MIKKLVISEPWDYIVDNTNSNHFYVKDEYEDIEYQGFKYKVYKTVEPFKHKSKVYTHVFLHNRHGVEDGCYNCFLGEYDEQAHQVIEMSSEFFIL